MASDAEALANGPKKNVSEALFEQYLNSQGLSFEYEKIYVGKSKRPDYTVPISGRDFLFEVKQFDVTDFPEGFSQFHPHVPLRAKIDAARKKFKEYEGFACCLVLYNNYVPLIMAENSDFMLGAMYGEIGFKMPFDPNTGSFGSPERAFLDGGKMLHDGKVFNTRISAIITLRHYPIGKRRYRQWWNKLIEQTKAGMPVEERDPEPDIDYEQLELGVIVWDNIAADIPLPMNIFRGAFDERWGHDDNGCIDRLYKGEGVVE